MQIFLVKAYGFAFDKNEELDFLTFLFIKKTKYLKLESFIFS
jgi:hypothetical protein